MGGINNLKVSLCLTWFERRLHLARPRYQGQVHSSVIAPLSRARLLSDDDALHPVELDEKESSLMGRRVTFVFTWLCS